MFTQTVFAVCPLFRTSNYIASYQYNRRIAGLPLVRTHACRQRPEGCLVLGVREQAKGIYPQGYWVERSYNAPGSNPALRLGGHAR